MAYKPTYTINYDVIPGNMVVPPERTMFAYKSFLMSTSHFMIELYVVSWIPSLSLPIKLGWKRTSGHLNRSLPMVITWRTLKNVFFLNCCFVSWFFQTCFITAAFYIFLKRDNRTKTLVQRWQACQLKRSYQGEKPVRQAARSSSPARILLPRSSIPSHSRERRSTNSLWCLSRNLFQLLI